jgi:hypothetical protein
MHHVIDRTNDRVAGDMIFEILDHWHAEFYVVCKEERNKCSVHDDASVQVEFLCLFFNIGFNRSFWMTMVKYGVGSVWRFSLWMVFFCRLFGWFWDYNSTVLNSTGLNPTHSHA